MVRRTMTVPRLASAGRFNPDCLFQPASVAVIGAEAERGAQILTNISLGGYQGSVQALAGGEALSHAPDLAILALPADEITPAVEALAAKGCFAAIVAGPADGLAELARRTGVRLLGPRSFGIAVPAIGLNATVSHMPPPRGRLAVVSQSAALCRAVIDWAGPNGVGFSHIIGIGGNGDIGFGMALDRLSRDAGTGAILLDIRRIKNRRVFLSAARAAARLRPVVAMRPGGRLLDHDGVADVAFEAALSRAGVLTVARLEDLLAAAETLSRAKPARGESLAVISNGIGPGRLAADTVLGLGLGLVDDDFRLVGQGELAAAVRQAIARSDIGGVLAVHAPNGAGDEAVIAALAELKLERTPLLVCAMGETTGALHRARLAAAGLPVFANPEHAVRGFRHLVRDRRNRAAARELPASTVLPIDPDRGTVARLFERIRHAGRLEATQDETLDVLAAYGVPVLPSRAVASPEDAALAANLLGYPAVVKVREATRPCARAHAGLALDLRHGKEVITAARRLPASVLGILVQRQAARARELAVRVTDDPTFGPMIAFGAGGTVADGTRDIAMDLPPLNLPLAQAMLQRCRTGRMLGQPLRDRPAANADAVTQALVRISQLIVDFPEIEILEAPSLFADADGLVVADAWLRLRSADAPPGRLAIAPWPAELAETMMAGEDRMVIRPIRPEDAEAHGAFFRRLSPQDIRYRFFSAVRELSPDQMARLTQVDYDREMAFIAIREATHETVGVARLVSESDGRSGEFAVIVQADMKGKGLASHLMRRLIDWGRSRGLLEIVGQVLADNAPMLAFVRHLGFTVHRMKDEPDVMEVRLELG